MTRKIIQIATSGVEENRMTQCEWICTALCDDGTVWETDNRPGSIWNRLPDIPQDEQP